MQLQLPGLMSQNTRMGGIKPLLVWALTPRAEAGVQGEQSGGGKRLRTRKRCQRAERTLRWRPSRESSGSREARRGGTQSSPSLAAGQASLAAGLGEVGTGTRRHPQTHTLHPLVTGGLAGVLGSSTGCSLARPCRRIRLSEERSWEVRGEGVGD